MSQRETEHLRVLIANERKDRLALVAPIVAALGHEVIAREIEVDDVGAVTARERPDVALVGLGESSEHALEGSMSRRLLSCFVSTRARRTGSSSMWLRSGRRAPLTAQTATLARFDGRAGRIKPRPRLQTRGPARSQAGTTRGFSAEAAGIHDDVRCAMGGTRKARAAALRFVTLPAAPESAGARRDIRPVSCNPPALAPLRFAEIQRDALRRAETGTKSGTEFTLRCPTGERRDHRKGLCAALFLSGAAQESNLPSVGLPRLTGFEGLLPKVHLRTEAGFRPRFSPPTCG